MTKYANIFNIQHFSINDGDGIRTVIFFKGCPLDCAWCHNPECKSMKTELSFSAEKCILCGKCAGVCNYGAHSVIKSVHNINREKCIGCGKCVDACAFSALELIGKKYTVDDVMEDIAKDDVFFADGGGVTFSGGEAFMQFDILYELLKMCKQKGYSACIETSGMTSEKNIISAADYTDCFLYDIKETDSENHKKYTGADNKTILHNLEVLNGLKATVVLRCPIIPGVNDRKEHFEKIAEIANKYDCIRRVELMPYHPLGILKAEKIGKKCLFDDPKFLDMALAEEYADIIGRLCRKPAKVSR